ncbi:Putative nucleoside transporter YegT [Maioricimonas rarisocia]|uniref:Nucleoside transporter YegT n=1 Tax=Maioricimonas rarisocia TaxID=2528026 RepID=A0A517Z6P6_9PLAN|nr:nucleoside permease [Maioricimonas rarisocia]QDU38158.1 Putative nucleoside transporter YegT [Maioricimonas rarisocia]
MQGFIGTRLSVMMFLQFFVWGGWYVTVGNYMGAHGMTDSIANAYTVGPIAAILSPLFLGLVADRFFATERVLGLLHIVGGIVLCAAPQFNDSPTVFVGVLLLHMLCYMPTLGLTNTLAFHNITDQEKQFPIIRVFGTIGWIVANIVVSKMLGGDKEAVQFYVAGGAAIALGVYSFTLPHTPPPAKGQPVSIGSLFGLDSLQLMKQRSFAVFMISSFLICIPLAAYYAYAPVFVDASGFENPAFNMSFGQMSEIVFMLVMPLCFRALGVKYMLLVGMLAWVARYGLFAMGAPDSILWMIMIGILLHGICYDFFFVTGQIYVDKKATSAIRGQAQGFLVLVTQGLGMLIGAQISGALFNSIVTAEGAEALPQWKDFWWIPCVAAGVIFLVFGALFRDEVPVEDVSEGEVAEAASVEEGM